MRNNYSSLRFRLGVYKGIEWNGMKYNVFKQGKGIENNEIELSNLHWMF